MCGVTWSCKLIVLNVRCVPLNVSYIYAYRTGHVLIFSSRFINIITWSYMEFQVNCTECVVYLIFMPRTGHVLIFNRFFLKFSGNRQFERYKRNVRFHIFRVLKLPLVIYVDFIKGVFGNFFTIVNSFFFNFYIFFRNCVKHQKNKIKCCKILNPNKKPVLKCCKFY